MKRLSRYVFTVVILLLAFATLDDIATGNEPDFTLEYLILTVTFPILGYLFCSFFVMTLFKTQRSLARLTPLRKYHIHHDLVGSLLLVFAFFVKPLWLTFAIGGFGIGMVVHHVITEGFVFVSKYSQDHLHRQLKQE